jgi:hypothetical protein
MLSQADIDFINSNRAEVTENRTESITLVRESQTGTDPYTGEPIASTTLETVSVVWKEYSTITNEERAVIGGVELRNGDVKVTFDATINLEGVTIKRDNVDYVIVTANAKGIGATNRQETLVRRAT